MPLRSASSTPRRRAPAAARRSQILDAALTCFAARGYHATTMDDLVEASGLSKGSLYWHFQSKEDVFLSLFDAFASEVFAAWDAAASREQDTLALLEREIEIVLQQKFAGRSLLLAWAEFLSHPEARQRMAELYRTSRRKLAGIVRRGVRRGELRRLPPAQVAAVLTASIEGMLLQSMVDPEFDVSAHAASMWQVLRDGVGS